MFPPVPRPHAVRQALKRLRQHTPGSAIDHRLPCVSRARPPARDDPARAGRDPDTARPAALRTLPAVRRAAVTRIRRRRPPRTRGEDEGGACVEEPPLRRAARPQRTGGLTGPREGEHAGRRAETRTRRPAGRPAGRPAKGSTGRRTGRNRPGPRVVRPRRPGPNSRTGRSSCAVSRSAVSRSDSTGSRPPSRHATPRRCGAWAARWPSVPQRRRSRATPRCCGGWCPG